MCQDYLVSLTEAITLDQLATNNCRIVVIGQGDASLIKPYQQLIGCPFDFYAQRSKGLYKLLGMTRTLAKGAEPVCVSSPLVTS